MNSNYNNLRVNLYHMRIEQAMKQGKTSHGMENIVIKSSKKGCLVNVQFFLKNKLSSLRNKINIESNLLRFQFKYYSKDGIQKIVSKENQDIIYIKQIITDCSQIFIQEEEEFLYSQDKVEIQEFHEIYRKVLQQLSCPISFQLMQNPGINENGHSYEIQNYKKWVKKWTTDPLTNEKLKLKNITPNRALKRIGQIMKPFVESYSSLVEQLAKHKHLQQIHLNSIDKQNEIITTLQTIVSKTLSELNKCSKQADNFKLSEQLRFSGQCAIKKLNECKYILLENMVFLISPNKRVNLQIQNKLRSQQTKKQILANLADKLKHQGEQRINQSRNSDNQSLEYLRQLVKKQKLQDSSVLQADFNTIQKTLSQDNTVTQNLNEKNQQQITDSSSMIDQYSDSNQSATPLVQLLA